MTCGLLKLVVHAVRFRAGRVALDPITCVRGITPQMQAVLAKHALERTHGRHDDVKQKRKCDWTDDSVEEQPEAHPQPVWHSEQLRGRDSYQRKRGCAPQ